MLERARQALSKLGYAGIRFRFGDGSLGWAEEAPFDAILVSAAAPEVPRPLMRQLVEGGRLVIPVGDLIQQDLMLVTRTETGLVQRALSPCAFVPLLGDGAWQQKED